MKTKITNKLTDLLFFLTILIFTAGLNFQDNPPNGWYQQFLPDLNGRQITDITFLDSLTGWAVTNATNQNPDTTFVLKTTDGGDNWVIQYGKIQTGGGFPGYFRVYFLNQSTGYTCGVKGLDKTTDGGISWISLNAPLNSYLDMSVLNTDSIWLVSSNSLTGGVFRTTNGGLSWQQQLGLGSQNPSRIYMYNERIGFITKDISYVRKTTNGGINWTLIVSNDGFNDIYFADSLTGWKCSSFGMKKTTDGGLNWVTQTLPSGGIISVSFIYKFSNINRDTIWGTGGYVTYPNNQIRGILYRTTNGGDNWLYQIPDTSIHISSYSFINFVNGRIGWVYRNSSTGIHTVTGGDTTFTEIQQISNNIPKGYKLNQNYPNPFNPVTKIKFKIPKTSNVKLVVYDILGKEIAALVNKRLSAGSYEYNLDATDYTSGVYFYKMIADDYFDIKKMLFIK